VSLFSRGQLITQCSEHCSFVTEGRAPALPSALSTRMGTRVGSVPLASQVIPIVEIQEETLLLGIPRWTGSAKGKRWNAATAAKLSKCQAPSSSAHVDRSIDLSPSFALDSDKPAGHTIRDDGKGPGASRVPKNS
jgi:hypothetical protein